MCVACSDFSGVNQTITVSCKGLCPVGHSVTFAFLPTKQQSLNKCLSIDMEY